MFKTIQRIHFIGIGGSGMSGIAEALLNLGYKVSGSDMKSTDVTERLSRLGADIHYGHKAENASRAQVVVTSTAVQSSNPEVVYARKHKIPVIPRIEMLAEIARLKYTIAVAGTHGKTTTTSMTAGVLQEGGLDPTFIVGGKVLHLQSGAKVGGGDFMVAEADESDGSFLKLSPTIGIITNIDNDHLDYYKTFDKLKKAFIEFGNHIPFYGCMIVCLEDPNVRAILPDLKRRVVSYGFGEKADYRAVDLKSDHSGSQYTLMKSGKIMGRVRLGVSGRHNVLNSLAAAACGDEVGIPFEKISRALESFVSVGRRLEQRGSKNGALWIDDYGHHPTEVRATLAALRERFPEKKLVVVFQPHRYSRTKILRKDFGQSFKHADLVLLMPIYAAGESPIPGITSKCLVPHIQKTGTKVTLLNGDVLATIQKHIEPDSVILTLGAGDVWKTGEKLFGLVK